jgi:UDPglucose--hexose-1-phosphate uridylyltransferase
MTLKSVPELRKDPVCGRWVIISTERGKRPSDFKNTVEQRKGGFCPFCPGNESSTPPEVLVYRPYPGAPNSPGWTTRVVPNKFPALQIEGDLDKVGEGMYDKMNGIGAHEVIIETPNHDATLPLMSLKGVEDMLWAYRDRIMDLKKDMRFKYILIFKNHGAAAGASLEHPHSQLIALPVLPKAVIEEMNGSRKYFNDRERCIFCDMVRQELGAKTRFILENESFVGFSPYAPRFPFEVWILPKRHISHFENCRESEYGSLAKILQDLLNRMDKVLQNPPYNYFIHTAPLHDDYSVDFYHWHLEIMPRLTKTAGFERGTDFYINPTPPEEASKHLREVEL